MPLILMSGFPCSGKTTRCLQLEKYFKVDQNKTVFIVSENKLTDKEKNKISASSQLEKNIRSSLKAEVVKLLDKDNLVILDAANYIKGFRYELYCASKHHQTPQCIVHCVISASQAWSWNENRDDEKYSQDVFDALIMRYETPDSRNRWDSPMFTLQPDDSMPLEEIFDALYTRKPPPPNQSTQSLPQSTSNFLYELDQATQVTLGELSRARRQFITYSKMHPVDNSKKLTALFIQYLNTTLN